MRDPSSRSLARHPLVRWIIQLFTYDGVLPAVVLLLPGVASLAFGAGVVIELIAVVLPIVAFFVRSAVGLRNIEENVSGALLGALQKAALFVGLLLLVLVDAFMILTWRMPANALAWGDYVFTAILYGCYLFLMAIATFPGLGRRQS